MKQELFELGHNERNIINAQHRTTRQQLNLFFVQLENDEIKKKIYNIKALQNKIMQIEPLRVNTNNIILCTRYQQYDHNRIIL